LLERKTDRSVKDIRRTAVAFANSVRPGHTAIILIGEGNDGEVTGVENPDEQQRRFRDELEKIYPPIVWRQTPYENKGKTCIRIEIEYSGETPHFGDAAWIRKGSETIKATDEIFQKLIDIRSAKKKDLMQWEGKTVTVSWSAGNIGYTGGPNWNAVDCELHRLSSYYCTFKIIGGRSKSEPIQWLTLSWDDSKNRLRIFVDPNMSLWS
jgi:Schlafen, AlbA_2